MLVKQSMAVNDIVSQCRSKRCLFLDPLFPADVSSLFKGAPPNQSASSVAAAATWTRLARPGRVLFSSDGSAANAQDVVQGVLGNCWFLGALSLATKSVRLSEILPFSAPEQGLFVVRFYRNRTRVDVVVDDLVPCNAATGEPLFAKNRNPREYWVSIIEKAAAKMCGSFYAMESGNESDALVDLTGGISFTLMLHEVEIPAEKLWQLLASYQEHGYLMGCANNRTEEVMGIVPSHAYGVLGVFQVPFSGTTVLLVKVRNPWGEREWLGAWSDSSPQWAQVSPQTKQMVGYAGATDDGTFFMVIDDFVRLFDKIYLCKTVPPGWVTAVAKGEWVLGRSAGGCSNNPTWLWNPQYQITVKQRTQAFVVLSQGDARKYGGGGGNSGGYENSIGFILLARRLGGLRVLSADEDGAGVIERIAYANTRERSVAVLLDPASCPYIIVPATFEAGRAAKFRITVFTEAAASPAIQPATEWPCSKEVAGSWTAELSGGCSNNTSTWKANPRFGIRVLSAGDIAIRLSTVAASRDLGTAPAVGIYILGDGDVASENEIVASTKSFSQHAVLRASLPPNTARPFSIIVATFRPGWIGEFVLTAFSFAPIELYPM